MNNLAFLMTSTHGLVSSLVLREVQSSIGYLISCSLIRTAKAYLEFAYYVSYTPHYQPRSIISFLMNATCPPLSLLADPSLYASLMHCLGSIELPIHVFCGYIILFKTPPIIQSVKFPLLYYHFWCSLLDFVITLLITPYTLFPELAAGALGILTHFEVDARVQFYLWSSSCCMVGVSLIGIFENRYWSIANPRRFRGFRSFFLITNHLIAITYLLPIYLLLPNQLSARNELIQRLPCLPLTSDIIVFGSDALSRTVMLAFNLPTAIWIVLQTNIYLFLTIRTLFFHSKNSQRTLALRKKFFIAILIQSGIPLIVIVGPLLSNVSTIVLGIQSQSMLSISADKWCYRLEQLGVPGNIHPRLGVKSSDSDGS